MLKELVWTYVIEAPALATQQFGQRRIIRTLFCTYSNAAASRNTHKMFPVHYREQLDNVWQDDEGRTRICIDFIAGMTERQATAVYLRLTGTSGASGLEDLLL